MAGKMLIIGSSNLRRIFKSRLQDLGSKLSVTAQFVSASHYESGCDAVDNLGGEQKALIGFLMNGLVDEVGNKPAEEIEVTVKKMVIEYAEMLKKIDKTVKIWVMQPFPRLKVGWSRLHLETVHQTLRIGLAGAANIKVIEYLDVTDEEFNGDGIHLTEEAYTKQYAHVVRELQDCMTPRPSKRNADWNEIMESAAKRHETGDEKGTSQGSSSFASVAQRGRGGPRG